jgi:hypothetical protein
MFHTPIVYAFIIASAIYHDRVWYPIKGRKVVRQWLTESPWGRLFADYKVRDGLAENQEAQRAAQSVLR